MANGIVQTDWEHDRSGAPSATGVLRASVYYSTKPCNSKMVAETQLSSRVPKETLLCSTSLNSPQDASSSAVVLSLTDHINLQEIIKHDPLNLWHYHAVVFRFWAVVQMALSIAQAEGLNKPDWVVILFPDDAWAQTRLGTRKVFLPSAENLVNALNSSSRSPNTLHSLQGLSDAFGGRLVLASNAASLGLLRSTMEEYHIPINMAMWVTPPDDGLMWDLAWDAGLSRSLSECRNSILLQYRQDMLNSVANQVIPKMARHVCVVSRQKRGLRNMAPEVILELLGRLGAPLILSPKTGLRPVGNASDGFPLHMESSSISGQMRFVYHECAVLLGVHGAGLTNALGLRPGTSVIELQTRGMTYQYFRNVAALMKDVDYTTFIMKGSGLSGKEELNLHVDDSGMQDLYELIQAKLEASMKRQSSHLN